MKQVMLRKKARILNEGPISERPFFRFEANFVITSRESRDCVCEESKNKPRPHTIKSL